MMHVKFKVDPLLKNTSEGPDISVFGSATKNRNSSDHSDYRTVSPYWVLPVYVELILAVWADDGDRPLLF
jgi:hypothetical protein